MSIDGTVVDGKIYDDQDRYCGYVVETDAGFELDDHAGHSMGVYKTMREAVLAAVARGPRSELDYYGD
jgi:3-methyladenine DNA glycosylase Mpg